MFAALFAWRVTSVSICGGGLWRPAVVAAATGEPLRQLVGDIGADDTSPLADGPARPLALTVPAAVTGPVRQPG